MFPSTENCSVGESRDDSDETEDYADKTIQQTGRVSDPPSEAPEVGTPLRRRCKR